MGSVNKQSLREEAERIQSEFQRISVNKKIDSDVGVLFQSMLMLINLLIAIFLEKTTKKNSKNSGMPPSQTEKDESFVGKQGSKGKGKLEDGATAKNTRTVESVAVAPVTFCDQCGESLEDVPCKCHERRTRIDIIFEKTVEHVDAEVKSCPSCRATVKGHFPADMQGPLQYGNGLKAFVIQLMVAQMLSLNRVQKMVATLIGQVISEATLLCYVMRLYCALEGWERSTIKELLGKKCINADETSLRVDKKNSWIHSYSSEELTLKLLHKKRGKEAMDDFNIIPRYGGAVVHDCWTSYLSYENCSHGLCGSHLLRELTFIIESNNYAWAKNMKRLLKAACANVSKDKSKQLSAKDYKRLQKNYRNILTRGEKELPPIPKRKSGKRGRIAKSDAHNLWERLKEHEKSVLLFAHDPHVSFTNNRAERDLRMSKVKQKVSGCFRVERYAKAYCRISSYLQTMANKGINPMIAVQMALTGEIYKEGCE